MLSLGLGEQDFVQNLKEMTWFQFAEVLCVWYELLCHCGGAADSVWF